MIQSLIGLAVHAFVAALAWNYYRCRRYPEAEKYETFGPRFWTGFIDACVLWPVSFVVTALLSLELADTIQAVLFVTEEVALITYTVLMHAKYGQTVGKMGCKVRVVDFKKERAITPRQALLREGVPIAVVVPLFIYGLYMMHAGTEQRVGLVKNGAFWLISLVPLVWFVAEVVTMLTNEKRRALHDLIAGTVVIRTNLASSKSAVDETTVAVGE